MFPFFHILASHLNYDLSHFNGGKMKSQSSFDLHFHDDLSVGHLNISQSTEFPLLRIFWLDLYPILKIRLFSWYQVFWVLYIFWIVVLYWMYSCVGTWSMNVVMWGKLWVLIKNFNNTRQLASSTSAYAALQYYSFNRL